MIVSTPLGNNGFYNALVEACSTIPDTIIEQGDNMYYDIEEPTSHNWCKKKNSLNHLPYEDRKKFWNRR